MRDCNALYMPHGQHNYPLKCSLSVLIIFLFSCFSDGCCGTEHIKIMYKTAFYISRLHGLIGLQTCCVDSLHAICRTELHMLHVNAHMHVHPVLSYYCNSMRQLRILRILQIAVPFEHCVFRECSVIAARL